MNYRAIDVFGYRFRTYRMRSDWAWSEARRNGLPRLDFARARDSVAVRIGRRVFSAYRL